MSTTPTERTSSLTTLTDAEIKSIYPGKTGNLQVSGLVFQIKVVDARKRFGHLDLKIVPANGHGERWIQSNRVMIDA